MTVIGIDPGLKGALAWVASTGTLLAVEDMPIVDKEVNAKLLADLIRSTGRECAVVERQQSMPKQGVSSVFKTGVGYGTILGVLAALDVPTFIVSSSVWKKTLHLTNDKEMSRKRALERWPENSDYFRLKKYEGRAEAALLAVAWLQSEGNDSAVRAVEVPPQRKRRRLVRMGVE